MAGTASKIEQTIKQLGRGSIFFPDDFVGLGSSDAIRQSLSRLHKEGKIIRVAQGIYCYPEIEEKLGLGIIYPSSEQIAEAIARRDQATIVPSGVYALNVLGLSTQVPMNYVFITDGSERYIPLYNGSGITFKNRVPKNMSFQNRLAMLITSALRSLKKANVEEWHVRRIGELLKNEPKESVMADFKLMPVWIRNIIKRAYE